MNLRTVDLFAGGGGLSLGFMTAGYEIVAAFDNWQPACDFYNENFKSHPLIKIDLSSPKAVATIRSYSPDIIIGGPPCQDFSSAGKRDETLGRANLTVTFANIIKAIKPKFFVMENVDRAVKSKAFARAKKLFKTAGYGLTVKILNAAYCGVPQLRKRVLVIGEMNGQDGFLNELLEKHLSKKQTTLRDYFGNRLGVSYYYRHPRSYARRAVFSIDEPSPTIRGVNRPVPKGYPGHPGDASPVTKKIRPLTTKERSLIQTFPENFILAGNKTGVEQVIGNAVPVKLAEYVALRLKEFLLVKKLINNNACNRSSSYLANPTKPINRCVLSAIKRGQYELVNV